MQWLRDLFRGYKLGARHGRWRYVRKAYLKKNPECEMCGHKKHLEVHHIVPYWLAPEKELDQNNLITLCGVRGYKCHLLWGHFKNYKKYNENIRSDALYLLSKLNNS